MLRLLRAVAFENGDVIDPTELLTRAPDMASNVPYWQLVDDLVTGYGAMVAGGQKYIPKFEDETDNAYKIRLRLTKFTNIYRDIVESLASKPFEKEVSLASSSEETKPPSQITEFIENVDGLGNNLTSFASLTMFNGINSAVDWIFVDHPVVDGETVRTMADQKRLNIRPFWSHVLAINVYEARETLVGGKRTLSYIRIFEPGENGPDRIRVFERDGGKVTWELYEQNEKGEWVVHGSGVLSIDVIPLVPFITGRRNGTSWHLFPAMRDAADLQVDLYQSESGLKFINSMANYPMLAANGIPPQLEADNKTPKKLGTGPMRVLYGISSATGTAGSWAFIEPTAAGMRFSLDYITATKEDLRELGRQPLTANSGNLTTITAGMAASKARSAVTAWAFALKDALENALLITGKFYNLDYDPEVDVYTDFDEFLEGSVDVEALITLNERGKISDETLWVEMQRRKVLSSEFDVDVERKRLLNEYTTELEV